MLSNLLKVTQLWSFYARIWTRGCLSPKSGFCYSRAPLTPPEHHLILTCFSHNEEVWRRGTFLGQSFVLSHWAASCLTLFHKWGLNELVILSWHCFQSRTRKTVLREREGPSQAPSPGAVIVVTLLLALYHTAEVFHSLSGRFSPFPMSFRKTKGHVYRIWMWGI